MRPRRSRLVRILAILPALAVLAACGGTSGNGASGSPTPSEKGTFPVTVKAANGPVTLKHRPMRIVSLSPTATEMLYAIHAGAQVKAVDSLSNYPANAPHTTLSSLHPNVEAIAKYRPDLVVIANDIGGLSKSLGKLSVPVLLQPAATSLGDTYGQLRQLGQATGHTADATHEVTSVQTSIRKIVADAPKLKKPLTFYHELDQTRYTATSKTFIGKLYGMLGMHDIADEAKDAGGGYPQLSSEYIVKADPDVIFLADTKCCGQTPTTVAKRPGWRDIAAVRQHAVFNLDDDVASRWGPRVVVLLRTIERDMATLPQAKGGG
ncbi:MAG: ABC transporter substrate-binding protein [Streptosporangiales bacterium]|nr:ABC transporter substrate-binding protein [Streptosporangiales bacterium]MBO0891541.1 ABC transporter substrate-binding protein [Acidothermales bacterium]